MENSHEICHIAKEGRKGSTIVGTNSDISVKREIRFMIYSVTCLRKIVCKYLASFVISRSHHLQRFFFFDYVYKMALRRVRGSAATVGGLLFRSPSGVLYFELETQSRAGSNYSRDT